MAKKQSTTTPTVEKTDNMSNQDDFKTLSNDVEGFWTGEGSITFVPRHANLCDNGADKSKASTLIIGQLLEADELSLENEKVSPAKGALVGVWFSPGMRPLLQCAGVVTRVTRTPAKDKKIDGKPSPMKAYDVATKKGVRGEQLEVLDDYRNQSAGATTPFSTPKNAVENQAALSEDDVPFA